MRKRQQDELDVVVEFVREYTFLDTCQSPVNASYSQNIQGMSPEDAYFAITSRGVKSLETTNVAKLNECLWGQKWFNWHITEWKSGIEVGDVSAFELREWMNERYAENVKNFLFKRLDFNRRVL